MASEQIQQLTIRKAFHPLILTARIDDDDLEPFDMLRKAHFPAERNFLRAHLTMFHHLPGEHADQIADRISDAAKGVAAAIRVDVSGLRHLGGGVAYTITGPELQDLRSRLRERFMPWLGRQDLQTWRPHITVQNKVSKQAADALHRQLSEAFRPSFLTITGLDLWSYLGGPWRAERSILFGSDR